MRPPCIPLDDSPSIFEVEETIKSMPNRKAVGPDELLAELLKLILDEDGYCNRHVLELFHDIVMSYGGAGVYRRSGKMPRSSCFRRRTGRDAVVIVASRSWHKLSGFFLAEIANRLKKYCE